MHHGPLSVHQDKVEQSAPGRLPVNVAVVKMTSMEVETTGVWTVVKKVKAGVFAGLREIDEVLSGHGVVTVRVVVPPSGNEYV